MKLNLKNIVVPLFFITVLIVGIKIYKDYGFSYDEQVSRENGIMSAVYANAKLGHILMSKEKVQAKFKDFKKDNPGDTATLQKEFDENALLTYEDRDYGVFFEMLLVGVESGLKLTDPQAIYQTRHLVTFLQYFIALVFFYLLCSQLFGGWKWALVATLFLLLSPRLFGQAFYNSKDMVQLSYFIISFYTLYLFLRNKTIKYAIIHGLLCAITIDIRIVGILVVALTGLGVLIEWLVEKGRHKTIAESLKPYIWPVALFAGCCIVFTLAFWPFLWTDPIGHFLFAVKNMKQFRWAGPVNYMGQHFSVPVQHLPWHFLLGWIMVSTPILYLLCFIIGVVSILTLMKKSVLFSDFNARMKLLAASLCVLPVLMVIVVKPVLYNDWRHFFFIYPFFIIIAICGLQKMAWLLEKWLNPVFAKYVLMIVIVFNSGYLVLGMKNNHPYEFMYFNEFVNRQSPGFELDYWGVSFKSGYEYILTQDNSNEIKVAVNSFPATQNLKMLSPESRKKIKLVSPQNADYIMANNDKDGMLVQGRFALLHTVEAYGIPMLYIYKKTQ